MVKITPKAVYSKDLSLKVTKPVELTNTSKLLASKITLGNTVTVTCSSTGGTGTKQYAVFYKQKSQSSWTKVKGYSTATTAKVTPKAATAYTVRVKVKDGAGTVVNKDLALSVSK